LRATGSHGVETSLKRSLKAGRYVTRGPDMIKFSVSQGVTDYPAAAFPVELMAAYPEAAIILSVRSEESWYKSMMSTLIHWYTRPDREPGLMARLFHDNCWKSDFPANGTAFFRAHNETVRQAAEGRKFLEYEPGMGWDPLCNFLGLQVPAEAFPRSDDWASYKKENSERMENEDSAT
jgi:hypothetical protein